MFIPRKFSILNCKNRIAVGDGLSDEAHVTLPNVAEIISRIIASSEGLLPRTVLK